MSSELMRREVQEALEAGERALSSLRMAQEKLNSARNWGILDLMGGGFFSDIMKHSKMNDASRFMENAKEDLLVFQRELRDVKVPAEFRMDVSGFLTFADFFFDGIVADYLVQSKIADARMQVQNAIERVEYLLTDLRQMLGYEE